MRGLHGVPVTLATLLAAVAVACSGGDDRREADQRDGGVAEPELRRELLAMMEADQADMARPPPAPGYEERVGRLREILDEHGWPTWDMVGRDGGTAAWLIAQHADLDLDLQERALELLRDAVDDGNADPTELAYLEDRVAVAHGEPQQYGTQIRCDESGEPVPATRIADREQVDERRDEVGLGPLASYQEEMRRECARGVPGVDGEP